MTRIVIGARNRVLRPCDTVFVSGTALLIDPNAHAADFTEASQIIWAWYATGPDGAPDITASMQGTEVILRAISAYNKPLVMLSTDAVFSGLDGSYTETDVAEPRTDYGRIKLAQEHLMAGFPRVRFTTFGPSYSHGRPLLIEMVAGRKITAARPQQFFSPIATPTLDDILRTLPPVPKVYHLATEAIAKTECCSAIKRSMGIRAMEPSFVDEQPQDFSLRSGTHTFSFNTELQVAISEWRALIERRQIGSQH